MRTLAVELAPYRIRVNSVRPCTVRSPMIDNGTLYTLFTGGHDAATWADVERPARRKRAPRPVDRAGGRVQRGPLPRIGRDPVRTPPGRPMSSMPGTRSLQEALTRPADLDGTSGPRGHPRRLPRDERGRRGREDHLRVMCSGHCGRTGRADRGLCRGHPAPRIATSAHRQR
ncbi:hypothetical protein ACQEVB_30085 [Pseudonocardia sp. CA-107938]|uniref:hypothetical protein n=1 Tax=Pseudonocardia sp. CA-107938 TaxID=3240021 RepID=UPI003D94A177